jgi:hypothetical protein
MKKAEEMKKISRAVIEKESKEKAKEVSQKEKDRNDKVRVLSNEVKEKNQSVVDSLFQKFLAYIRSRAEVGLKTDSLQIGKTCFTFEKDAPFEELVARNVNQNSDSARIYGREYEISQVEKEDLGRHFIADSLEKMFIEEGFKIERYFERKEDPYYGTELWLKVSW